MHSAPISPFKKAWYKWKALHLPWRKRFLVGLDLQGNTYWEFRDTLSSHKNRMRRIVQYPPSVHHSDLDISPQWHQWLRHTRPDPPSLTEQSQDLVRQERLKVLAKQADARWAAKPSVLDAPGKERGLPLPAMQAQAQAQAAESTGSGPRTTEALANKAGTRTVLREGSGTQEQAVGTVGEVVEEQKGEGAAKKMQVPDGIRHQFNERPGQRKRKDIIEPKADPWKQARGGPSEEWQPKAWDGTIAAKR